VAGFEPAASAGHGGVQSAEEHDTDDGLKGARGKFFAAGDEISGGVIDENIERTVVPDGSDHGFDGVKIADVAGESVDGASGQEFRSGFLEYLFAAAADVDRGAEVQKAVSHGFAEACAAAGDEDAFGVEKIRLKHGFPSERNSSADRL